MGESIMAGSTDEDKIGETAASDRSLEVSVSFGRFENDSLSWEKWSSFSQNKYLEEVEKCATPGSVAQKKAYFEAHYKKIAARKAEQSDQQKIMEHESLRSSDQNGGEAIDKSCGRDSEFDISNGETAVEGIKQEAKFDNELGTNDVDEPNEVATINMEDEALLVERVEELSKLDSLTLNKPEEPAVTKEGEILSVESQEIKESPKKLVKEKESIPVIKKERVKLNPPKEFQKISPLSKVRDMTRIKKKPASPVVESPQNFAAKVSKTVPTSSNLSAPWTPTKKATVSPVSKNKVSSMAQSKKVAPKSLHMSISMDTPSSDPAPPASAPPTTIRKSFIMEKMKDKEIVKRAFKTFQNNFNQLKSSAQERSLAAKQVSTKGTENKVSSSINPRKENAGSLKSVSMDKKTAKAAPSSFGLKSDERAEKRRELSKKFQEKSKANEAESTRVRTKSKEEKDADIRKLRQSLNFRPTSMPGFYRGREVPKSPLDKEGSKTLGI